jgi:RNA polymerase sigma-70 factor (ECF subfamily)
MQETGKTSLPAAERAVLFESVFKAHFKNLNAYALMIVKDQDVAEEMVQQVFFKLWEQQEETVGQESVATYLYRAVHNTCLNHLKHAKVREGYRAHVHHTGSDMGHNTDHAAVRELREKINEVLNELPEQCRTIFQMSRYEDMKYRSIAEKLGISVKTVENQLGKALRILRTRLTDYLPILMLLFVNVKYLLS